MTNKFVPYGYSKDKHAVYYYNFGGKANIVKRAISTSVVSLNDGYFGYDENAVCCGSSRW